MVKILEKRNIYPPQSCSLSGRKVTSTFESESEQLLALLKKVVPILLGIPYFVDDSIRNKKLPCLDVEKEAR